MITSLYAGLFGLLYIQITNNVISERRRHKVSVGYGKNNEISHIASAHANFSSFVPFALIMLYLIEQNLALPSIIIHILGFAVLLGRLLHYLAFKGEMNFKLRIAGMILTIFPLIILSLLNIYSFFVV